jgi:5-methylcytosine-specific restriction enzyme subunit McrC
LARAVFDLVLPTEQEGVRSLFKASRDDMEFRKLFERAIGNFFAAELPREEGWRVYPGKQILSWLDHCTTVSENNGGWHVEA